MPGRLALEQIYDAAFDDGDLHELTLNLGSSFEARSTLIHWVHFDGSADVLSHSRYFTDEQLSTYAQDFVAQDPWIHATASPAFSNVATNLEELVPVDRFISSDFYKNYVRELGDDTCRCLGVRLQSKWGAGFVSLQRGRFQKSFDAEAVASLQNYAEHLTRMLAARGRLATALRKSTELATVVNAIGEPAFLVDAGLRILQANRAAELLMGRQSVFRTREGVLTASTVEGDKELRTAVARAISVSGAQTGAIALHAEGRAPLELSIMSVPGPTGSRLALIIGSRPPVADDTRNMRLRSLFGLTPGEASLALLLSEGMSPAEIADERRVAVGTVRVQIKQIAAKLGCSRQSEIVRVVSTLPQFLVGD